MFLFYLAIFLIIVGRHGSSKTLNPESKSLSVEILKLVLSSGNYTLRHKLGDLPFITELYFLRIQSSVQVRTETIYPSIQRRCYPW